MIDATASLRAAEQISTSALIAYLRATGWSSRPSRIEGIEIFSKQIAGANEAVQFILPVRSEFVDERNRVADALRAISQIAGCSEAEIANEVRRTVRARVSEDVASNNLSSAKRKVTEYLKLQVPAGSASPSPPIGPALGKRGLNIMEFCKAFNAKTQKEEKNTPIPVVITIYADRSFTFEMKTPPMSYFLKKAAKIVSGSKAPSRDKAGKVTKVQVREIAERKMKEFEFEMQRAAEEEPIAPLSTDQGRTRRPPN